MKNASRLRALVAAARGLHDDRRGVALIEMAFALPILVTLFVGGYQISDAVFAYRKVTTTTRMIADVTSQYDVITPGDIDQILDASTQVMYPYSPANAKLLVSQVTTDANGVSTVSWSRGRNVTALVEGSAYTLPASIKQNGTSLVIAQTIYPYQPRVATSILGAFDMKDVILMSPRKSNSVLCDAC